MGIQGILIQKFIKYFDKFIKKDLENPTEVQENLFYKIIKRNSNTDFGKRHHFNEIRTIENYQEKCQPQKYEYFRPYIEQIFQGNLNSLFNAHLVCFGQTPGTTSEPKIIPIIQQSFSSVSIAQTRIYTSYISEDPINNSKFLEGITCFFSAYPILRTVKINNRSYNIGYGTGLFSYPILYNISHIWKLIFKRKMFIPIELNVMTDLDKKYRYLTQECIKRDIRCFSGTPPIIINYLEKILEYSEAKNITDLFPNLHLLNFGGIPPLFYEKRIKDLIGHPIDYREMYAATEGVIGYQLSDTPLLLTPALDANFFEYIPIDEPDKCCTIADIKKNVKYHIVLTTYNGFYRYKIGDIIEFKSIDPPLFMFIDRENSINLMDEKMTLDQISIAIRKTFNDLNVIIKEFAVVGDRHANKYIIIIEFKDMHDSKFYKQFIDKLDEYLCNMNATYKYFRKNVKTIKPPELRITKRNAFDEVEKERVLDGQPRHQLKILQVSMNLDILNEFDNKIIDIAFASL
ncbi:MAG: GH3 family domain-containing protein [Candidatus Helarchaeota archaeon]